MAALHCPRCGYNISNKMEAGYPPTVTHEPAIPFLQAEAQRLEELIHHLTKERAAVLSNINHHQAKTRKLPSEILSTIFQMARPPIDFDTQYVDFDIDSTTYYHPEEDFHHTLAAVSHVWRLVALSTPQLWTSIMLRVDDKRAIKNITSLLSLHIQRARSVPISVQLDFRAASELWDKPFGVRQVFSSFLEPLKSAIFVQHAAMIGELIFIEPPLGWLSFPNNGPLVRCHSLTLLQARHEGYALPGNIKLAGLPCLQRVKLIETLLDFPLPDTVTAIHFRELAFSSSFRTLARSPQVSEVCLVECPVLVVTAAIRAIGRPLHSSGLRQRSRFLTASPETVVLPNLCKLFIISRTSYGKVKGQDIVDMMEALYVGRRDRGRFRLVMEPDDCWDYEEGVLERLKGLVKDGFDLEVVTGSRRLNLA